MKLMLRKGFLPMTLLAIACKPSTPPYNPPPPTADCYEAAQEGYRDRTDKCATQACVDLEAARLRRDQEACP